MPGLLPRNFTPHQCLSMLGCLSMNQRPSTVQCLQAESHRQAQATSYHLRAEYDLGLDGTSSSLSNIEAFAHRISAQAHAHASSAAVENDPTKSSCSHGNLVLFTFTLARLLIGMCYLLNCIILQPCREPCPTSRR
ncbi:hypothetical protein P171DRAFT_56802 [Karstenula rhodostoma CBS 690.94]|uniref:Uncharacterized protein n=1 Tax=Karstenula rhodostoma CBS 690.94 TaxID=1392251 RepID=A0A9P4PDR7_9PLEO|nr:hypothetical protein P171DRAFT_56802 [Karstenula rhodostoma CBS 690.94]